MATRTLPNILTDDEEQALLKTFNRRYPTARRNRCMIDLALTTGMRIGDLVNLKWEDIELSSGRCHVKRGKGQKDRVLFVKAEILSDLLDLAKKMNRPPEGLVFTTLKGGLVQRQYLRRMIAAQARKAVIGKRVHFHLLRHTYLTKLYAETKDLRLVQEVAGHANVSTTMIYTHVSGEDVREAMLNHGNGAKQKPAEPIDPAPAITADVAALKKRILTLESMLETDPEDERIATEKLKKELR